MSIMHAESPVNLSNYSVYFENFNEKILPKINAELRGATTHIIVPKSAQSTFFMQFKHLTKRSFLNMKRNPLLLRSRAIQAVVLGIFTGIVYLSLPSPEESPNS